MNKEQFIKELAKLDINLTDYQLNQLEEYYNLLVEENKKYNLTSITNKEDVYLKHFYDSLTISKIIKLDNQSICDIGTGAGFPGLVLKIAYPNTHITLIDSTLKKCNFLKMITDKLKLKNIEIINDRAEIYAHNNREVFDIVTSRAVAPLKHLLEYSIPLLKIDGLFISMKGNIDNEIYNIKNYEDKLSITLIDKIEFHLPNENSLRTLIKYQKKDETNTNYPRKYSEIKKKDL
ncbi:MAG: 16S rRNA (guanine(527)-N(7))-methyltransferase RsmG [Bacilli bacterium]|nr:16S rRNA (guanine(527)-N(7))-methyltransferase RsmG [Bacilli bacterium]